MAVAAEKENGRMPGVSTQNTMGLGAQQFNAA
jgi:hypothetical protein